MLHVDKKIAKQINGRNHIAYTVGGGNRELLVGVMAC